MQVCVTSWANCPSEDCSRPRPLFDNVCVSVRVAWLHRLLGLLGQLLGPACSKLHPAPVLQKCFWIPPVIWRRLFGFYSAGCETFLTSLKLREASSGSLQPRCRNISQAIKRNRGAQSSNQSSCQTFKLNSKFRFHAVILGFWVEGWQKVRIFFSFLGWILIKC